MASEVTNHSDHSLSEIDALRTRLQELEDTLRAIRNGQIDALLLPGPAGDQVFTLQGAEHPYRVLVEAMNEGAATLSTSGVVLYANPRFSEMLGTPLDRLLGMSLRDVIHVPGCDKLEDLLSKIEHGPQKVECEWHVKQKKIPVYLSLSPLHDGAFRAISVVATDLTDIKRNQKDLATANESLRIEVAQRMMAEEALRRDEESLRQLSGRLLQLQDEERRRIARDLHDSTGQKLVALTLDLTLLESFRSMLPEKANSALSESFALAEQISSEVRTLSYLLHPPLLDEVGLSCAVRWYIDGFIRRSDIAVELTISDLPRMSHDLEIALFRVLQESLTNVHRHSGSRTAHVRFLLEGNAIVLEVEDSGDSATSKHSGLADGGGTLGVGIRGMKERVRQLGGTLVLVPGMEGTLVRASLPLESRTRRGSYPTTPQNNLAGPAIDRY
jgi:PAS domain S-box-containing protein